MFCVQIASPACTELEVIMLDWLGKMLDLPKEFLACSGGKGGGVIQVIILEQFNFLFVIIIVAMKSQVTYLLAYCLHLKLPLRQSRSIFYNQLGDVIDCSANSN